ncbi:MAG: hypothetical protein ACE14S_10335 [Candidatus Bathyarchaeia archaeon]
MEQIKTEFITQQNPEIKELFSKDWLQLVFGLWNEETKTIFLPMDSLLKVYELFGSGFVEEWFSEKVALEVTHELVHACAPHWSERQVERAVSVIFGGEKD